MTQTNASPKLYALLIGINFYFYNRLSDDSEYRNLDGAVNDINNVEKFLQQQPKKPDKVYKLTATAAKRESMADFPVPIEKEADLPTYANIIDCFNKITKQAEAGDKVYIHYSGHGGRARSIYPKSLKPNGIDEALVPTDIGSIEEGQYIRDLELAILLKRMVDKGLVVSVILDSCHSGGSTRGGKAKIRGLKHDLVDETPRLRESLVKPTTEELNAIAPSWRSLKHKTRGGTPVATMIPEAKGYVLLAACRPSEFAYEDTFDDDVSNGALTYWLLDTLKQPFPNITYKMIHDRISGKINTQFAMQNPMLLGEGDRQLLGDEYNTTPFAVVVNEVKTKDNTTKIRLNAGQAHGLRKGAEFAIYPSGTADFTDSSQRLAVAKIIERGATESWAEVTTLIKQEPTIETGSQAVLTAVPVKLLKKVRLLKDTDTPSERESALQAIEAAITNNGWVRLIAEETETADYQVDVTALDNKIVYQICDRAGEPIKLRPAIDVNEPDAATKIVKRLVHLTKYQATAELDNHDFNSKLKGKIKIEVLGKMDDYEPGDPIEPEPLGNSDNLTVNVGEYLFLKIRNDSKTNLNFTVLDLQSNWAISQIEPSDKVSLYTELGKNEEQLIALKMALPEGEKTGSDIFKVFATKDEANFRWLTLPPLDKPFPTPKERGIVKTRAAELNALGQMLAYFAEETPEPKKNATRTGNPVAFPSNDWTTEQVTIYVKKKTVLILPFNFESNQAFDLERETNKIQEILGKIPNYEGFEVKTKQPVHPKELYNALLETKPQIIHFSGHGTQPSGLVFKGDSDAENYPSIRALVNSLPQIGDIAECVILDGCYSESQADALNEYVDVIGMDRVMPDNAANEFKMNFYDKWSAGKSIKTAYEIGKKAVLESSDDETISHRGWMPDLESENFVLPKTRLIPVLKQTRNPKPTLSPITLPSLPTISSSEISEISESNPVLLRYPYIECPNSAPINRRFTLFVEILIESPEPEIKAMRIQDTGLLEKLPEVEIVIRARSFDIEGSNTRIIQVERDDDTEARFVLIPRKLGEQQIRVDFYQNDERISTIRKNILINSDNNSATREIYQPENQTSLEIKNKFSVPPPDLELCIELDKNDNKTLYFTLHSSKSSINYHHKYVGDYTLKVSPEKKMKSVYEELGHLAERVSRVGIPINLDSQDSKLPNQQEEDEDILNSVGYQLWDDLIPDDLKREYWNFKDKVNSFLITSDEPWIPWEIIKPYDGERELEDPFWCEQFAISRWLAGDGLADTLPSELIITVAPDHLDLPNVTKEISFIKNLANISSSVSSVKDINNRAKLRQYLNIKSQKFSILHFACHGMFDCNLPNESAINLGNNSLRPAHILVKFKQDRPIVFINACHGSQIGFSFTKIGGWAKKFVDANVGVFIGAMWEVNDELACQFAQTFYTYLLKNNLTVAEAFQKSRQVIRDLAPYNSTWLAYSLYAKPEARIIQQAQ